MPSISTTKNITRISVNTFFRSVISRRHRGDISQKLDTNHPTGIFCDQLCWQLPLLAVEIIVAMLTTSTRLKLQNICQRISEGDIVSLQDRVYLQKFAERDRSVGSWLSRALVQQQQGKRAVANGKAPDSGALPGPSSSGWRHALRVCYRAFRSTVHLEWLRTIYGSVS